MKIRADAPAPTPRPSERCCPTGECVYRPELVEKYLGYLRGARKRGEDPTVSVVQGQGSGCDSPGRSSGVSTSLDIRYLGRLWDVQRAQHEGAVTVDEVCRMLCPWALEDAGL